MKVLFLDFDGVLNSLQYDREKDATKNNSIDETRLRLLKKVIDETKAKIVLTTSWRRHWNKARALCDEVGLWISELFSRYGLDIYDKTPDLPSSVGRKSEILDWLNNLKEPVESFVILDDYAFGWEELGERLIKTSPYIGRGLEETHVKRAIEILNN